MLAQEDRGPRVAEPGRGDQAPSPGLHLCGLRVELWSPGQAVEAGVLILPSEPTRLRRKVPKGVGGSTCTSHHLPEWGRCRKAVWTRAPEL